MITNCDYLDGFGLDEKTNCCIVKTKESFMLKHLSKHVERACMSILSSENVCWISKYTEQLNFIIVWNYN